MKSNFQHLDQWVTYWQRRFRLRDWKITARIGRPYYTDDNGERIKCDGTTTWDPGTMTAEIVLSQRADNRVLCHEMLHLVLEGEQNCAGYKAVVERRIERIVECIFEFEPILKPYEDKAIVEEVVK